MQLLDFEPDLRLLQDLAGRPVGTRGVDVRSAHPEPVQRLFHVSGLPAAAAAQARAYPDRTRETPSSSSACGVSSRAPARMAWYCSGRYWLRSVKGIGRALNLAISASVAFRTSAAPQ